MPLASKIPSHVPADLVVDFDYWSFPEMDADPQAGLSKLRSHPNLFYTPRYGGHWVATRGEVIKVILGLPEVFTSRFLTIPASLATDEFPLIPVSLDPPVHAIYRNVLNPYFSPKAVGLLEAHIRQGVITLIEGVRYRGHIEFAQDMANVMPVEVFLRYMGFPTDRRDEFIKWMKILFTETDPRIRKVTNDSAFAFIRETMAARRAEPRNDIISNLLTTTIEGRPLTDTELIGIFSTLFFAGLETVKTALTFMMRALAQDASRQQRLRKDTARIPQAVAELMRRFGIVNLVRTAVEDTEVLGVRIKSGESVWCPTAVTGVDARENSDPLKIDFDRRPIVHTAFGHGPHRCLGQNLANLEMRIFFEEWLARVPDVRILPNSEITANSGPGFALSHLPLEWDT